MAGTIRDLFPPDLPGVLERSRTQRLCAGDIDAVMELYDELAPLAYTWALHLTRSERKSATVLRRVFARAAEQPHVFCDQRISGRGWVLAEVHRLAWAMRPPRHRATRARVPAAAAGTSPA